LQERLQLMVGSGNAHVNARAAAVQTVASKARLLDDLPRGLKQKPFLRIDAGRLAGADAAESRIEAFDIANKSAPPAI
jgi:hypothetical protein